MPTHLMDLGFNVATNIFVNIGTLVSMMLAIGMPARDGLEIRSTHYWQIVYAVPIIFIVLPGIALLTIHPRDGLYFHVERGEYKDAMVMIKNMYSKYDYKVH